MSGFHARVAPSALSRIAACPGSLQMCEKAPPEPETPESLEGDVAHWVAMNYACGTTIPSNVKHKGVLIDDDMVSGALTWKNYVDEAPGAYEMPIASPGIHETCWGSTDYWSWVPERNTLYVGDYKYGHMYVEEFENEQGVGYCDGLIKMLGIPETARVEFTIVQPRCYFAAPRRTWKTSACHISFLAKQISHSVEEALSDSPTCRTSNECLFCPARGVCKDLQFAAEKVIEFSRTMALVDNTNPAAVGLELALLEDAETLLKARKTGLAQMAEAAIRAGQSVPGWGMKAGQSRLDWNAPDAAIAEAANQGIDLTKPVAPITPTQALERKLIDQAFVDRLASRPPAGVKLARTKAIETRKLFASNRG